MVTEVKFYTVPGKRDWLFRPTVRKVVLAHKAIPREPVVGARGEWGISNAVVKKMIRPLQREVAKVREKISVDVAKLKDARRRYKAQDDPSNLNLRYEIAVYSHWIRLKVDQLKNLAKNFVAGMVYPEVDLPYSRRYGEQRVKREQFRLERYTKAEVLPDGYTNYPPDWKFEADKALVRAQGGEEAKKTGYLPTTSILSLIRQGGAYKPSNN